tara:strand:- start:30760 stop:31794 length:1035 start_codon:yes stop_codon:yes gene_type:complete
MKLKKALITGITGQDGSWLARFLLKKNYNVYGLIRRSSSFNTQRIDDLYNTKSLKNRFKLFYGDLTDETSINNIIKNIKPDEIYNLAAQSHVKVSFENPVYTANVAGIGTLRILEAIKTLKLKTKFYQASTSEMFGNTNPPQNEKSRMKPNSPYAAAKLYANEITRIYRDGFGIFACNGILFNHESEVRGETFVTKKITRALVRIKLGKQKILEVGNLYSKRDWGYAPDYVESMWKMLQMKKPDDYVIATGKSFSVKEFILETCKVLNLKIKFIGRGIMEKGVDPNNNIIIKINKKYYRPLEVDHLRGDYKKAKKILNWLPKTQFKSLVSKMVKSDFKKETENK